MCSRYRPGVAQRVVRGIALLFHDRGTRRGWGVSVTPRPLFISRKDLVPILQEDGWAPGPVWTGGKSRPHRDSIMDHPARSQSLYRLSYPVHKFVYIYYYIYPWCNSTPPPRVPRPSHYRGFVIAFRHYTVGGTPVHEWSARRRDLYLTTHNRQTSMHPVGFKPTISAGERPQTHALDRTGHRDRHVMHFFLARQPPVGQDLLIHEVSKSHTTTHHSR